MLTDHIGVGSNRLDTLVIIILEVFNGRVRLIGTQTMTEVQTETVHLILRQPVFQRTDEHLMRRFETMVPVLIDIIRVRSGHIKPGIARQIRTVRIEFVHRVQTRSMVEHHIENNRYTAFVALVDELLIHRLGAVRSVRREIVVRRIAPVIVTVKLTDRHQLDGIHA